MYIIYNNLKYLMHERGVSAFVRFSLCDGVFGGGYY